MRRSRVFYFACLLLLSVQQLAAQDAPFKNEIQNFRKQDSVHFPSKKAILFVGSSSFRLWRTVQESFPGYMIINRGFGGSSLPDVIRYAPEIIYPYQPKQVVIYCGENDFASSDTVTAPTVFNRFRELFTGIREHLPQVPVAFVSIKPSPSRRHLLSKMEQANQLIKDFLGQQKHTAFIDVYPLMMQDGKPDTTLFLGDKLHMNEKGYAIWQKAIVPYLKK